MRGAQCVDEHAETDRDTYRQLARRRRKHAAIQTNPACTVRPGCSNSLPISAELLQLLQVTAGERRTVIPLGGSNFPLPTTTATTFSPATSRLTERISVDQDSMPTNASRSITQRRWMPPLPPPPPPENAPLYGVRRSPMMNRRVVLGGTSVASRRWCPPPRRRCMYWPRGGVSGDAGQSPLLSNERCHQTVRRTDFSGRASRRTGFVRRSKKKWLRGDGMEACTMVEGSTDYARRAIVSRTSGVHSTTVGCS